MAVRDGGAVSSNGRKRGKIPAAKGSRRTTSTKGKTAKAEPELNDESVGEGALQQHHAAIILAAASEIGQPTSSDDIFYRLAEIACRELATDRATIFLNDDDTQELYSRVALGAGKLVLRIPNVRGAAGHVFQSGEPLILIDAYNDPRFNADLDAETGYQTRNLVTVPITTTDNDIIGVAQVLNKIDGDFDEDDMMLLRELTVQASRALNSERNIRRDRRSGPRRPDDAVRQLRQAEVLLNVSRRVADTETLDDILATLLDITVEETLGERGTIFLFDPQTEELYSRSAQGDFKREIRISSTSGIAGHVFTIGDGLIIADAYADARFNPSVDEQTGFRTRNILCAPIRTVMGEIIGVAQVLNRRNGDFTESDQSMLEALTMQSAMALQSTQYLERMKRSREEEIEFLDVVADVTSEIELGVLLKKVMAEATRMLRADRSTLFLHDEKTNELWSEVGEGLKTG